MNRGRHAKSATASASPAIRRLWRIGVALGIVVLSVAASETVRTVRQEWRRLSFGHDLLPSYTAGLLVRRGRSDALYDAAAFRCATQRVMDEARLTGDARFAVWVNPPIFAWVFAPLSYLPYRAAVVVWLGISLALLAVSIVLLRRIFGRNVRWRVWGLAPLGIVVCVPFWQAIGHLQNTFLSLAILSGAVSLWRTGRGMSAGLVAGLLFYKPQLALVVAAALVLSMGWRAIVGIGVTGATMLAINVLTLPGSISAFLTRTPGIVHELQTRYAFNWGRQVTPLSFWRLLIQGHVIGETEVVAKIIAALTALLAAVAVLAVAARVVRRRHDADARDALIGVSIISMPLLMPYYMDYDLLLLVVPLVLYGRRRIELSYRIPRLHIHDPRLIAPPPSETDRLEIWLARAWSVLFGVAMLNATIASMTRWNLIVPSLAATAGLSVMAELRRDRRASTMTFALPASLAA